MFLQPYYLKQPTDYQPLAQASQQAGALQAQAAREAGDIGQSYLQQAGQQLGTYGTEAQQMLQPYADVSQQAVGSLAGLTGVAGPQQQQQAFQDFQSSPAYRFNVQEQLDALQRYAGARGKLYSGQAMKELQQRASGLASQEMQQQIQNQMGLLGQTRAFPLTQAQQGMELGRQQAGITSNIGEVLGGARIGEAAALGQGLLGAAQANVMQSASDPGAPIYRQQPTTAAGYVGTPGSLASTMLPQTSGTTSTPMQNTVMSAPGGETGAIGGLSGIMGGTGGAGASAPGAGSIASLPSESTGTMQTYGSGFTSAAQKLMDEGSTVGNAAVWMQKALDQNYNTMTPEQREAAREEIRQVSLAAGENPNAPLASVSSIGSGDFSGEQMATGAATGLLNMM